MPPATARRFGWKPSPPDFRDHIFAAASETVRALPPSVDLAKPPFKPPLDEAFDQGNLGSCGPQTAAGNLVVWMLRNNVTPIMPSRLFIYYATRLIMGTVNQDSGVYNRDLLKSLNQYGWCDEEDWPYTIAKFKTKPPANLWTEALTRRITEYQAVPQNLTQMKGCLAEGRPFIYGFTVYESFMSATVEDTGKVPMPGQSEGVLGGHDVLIVGYDDATQRFKFLNSWGDWGENGFGTMPYGYATDRNLSGDFWTIKHAGLPVPTPTPGRITFTLNTDLKAGTYAVTPAGQLERA